MPDTAKPCRLPRREVLFGYLSIAFVAEVLIMKWLLIVLSFVLRCTLTFGQGTNSSQTATTGCVNSPDDRQCWGDFDINTNYYDVTPDTGNTVVVILF